MKSESTYHFERNVSSKDEAETFHSIYSRFVFLSCSSVRWFLYDFLSATQNTIQIVPFRFCFDGTREPNSSFLFRSRNSAIYFFVASGKGMSHNSYG